VSHPEFPAPARRPSRPLPPLPQYGGRTPPPWPQPTQPAGWAATAAPPAYDDRYDDRYDDEWDEPGYHDWESWDEPRRTNRAAIWGFVLAFLVAPAGLVLSAVGMRQARRRGEKGRGLAIAGLVISLVLLAAGALVLVSGAMDRLTTELRTATGTTAAQRSLPPAGPAPASVLDACTTLMPTLEGAEASMTAAQTEQQAAQVVVDMHTAVITAAGAPDPNFQAHLGTLATDLESLLTAFDTGQVPAGLEQTMEQDSFLVGKDCGLAGWTQ